MADSSQTQFAYVAETNYGVIPSNPVWKKARITSEGLVPAIQYVSSNEARPDRNVPDLTQVGGEAAGPVGFEMSYGSFDDWLEALLGGTWASNVLKNGVVQRSFALEKKFETGVTDQYHRYIGARVNSMSLGVRAREIITGSFEFMAKGAQSATSIVTGATYTDPNTNPVINASSNLQNLAMSGITSPEIMSIDLSITNNMRQQPVVGSINSKGIGTGRFVVTGSMNAYFENSDMYDAYVNNVATDLEFEIGGASTLKYKIELPKVKFSGAQILAGGNDQDVMASMNFQAIYDATEAATLKITRTP